MKVRDSGMPEEKMWANFFHVGEILDGLQVNETVINLIEIGCGYGTFTIETAKRIKGKVYAFDLETEMIECTRRKAELNGISNIDFQCTDFITNGSGILNEAIDYVMLFNILHHEKPLELLEMAHKTIRAGGKVGIIHWRTDIETPRGPSMSIRPKPEQCVEWAGQTGFKVALQPMILEPYHYGLVVTKT